MEHKKEHHVFEFGCLRLNILKAPLTLWRRLPNGNSDQSFHNHTKKLLTFWEKNPRSISLFTFTYYSFQTKFPLAGKITSHNSIGRKSEEVGTKPKKEGEKGKSKTDWQKKNPSRRIRKQQKCSLIASNNCLKYALSV